MIKKWELVKSEKIYDSPFLTLYKDELKRSDGTIIKDFFSVKRSDAVFVVALTEKTEVILVNQYRNGIKEVIWETPAGFIDAGEAPAEAAARELLEETGFAGNELTLLGSHAPNPGAVSNRNFSFLIKNAKKVAEPNFEGTEEIEVGLFDLEELVTKILNRTSFFVDTQSQLALLLAWEEFKK